MTIQALPKNLDSLQNIVLHTQIQRKSDDMFLRVSIVSSGESNKMVQPYITMKSALGNYRTLSLMSDDKRIGGALIIDSVQGSPNLFHIDNFAKNDYGFVGTALVETMCRIVLQAQRSNLSLCAKPEATGFHFKMGFRFADKVLNNEIKSRLAQGLPATDGTVSGIMYLDLMQPPSDVNSPRIAYQSLKNEPENLAI